MNSEWPDLPAGILVQPALMTSGQPSISDFSRLAKAGVRTVINLALPTSSNALPDERTVVTGLGMEYLDIPVPFESPGETQYLACEVALRARSAQPVLLHCALNYRVSSFVAIYRVRRLGWTPEAAWAGVRAVWEPDAVWERVIRRLSGGHH